ncbi:MAG: response regulator [Deltaproteobacteria bacterium]|nr:response regulator [Deltaproteobacteria bacterium]
MKFLVADDSMVMRSIITKVINSLGHETVHAANGQQVLELVEEIGADIDLVLLDWNMPVLNGVETVKAIRGGSRFSAIPIIMISTESEDAKIDEALKAGATGYVPKPFTPEALSSAIQKALTHNAIV